MSVDLTLYLVTDRSVMSTNTLQEAVEDAILGGCTMVQLREKELPASELYQLAKDIKDITDRYHVPFILNDHVDIALAVDAAGVHVGPSDLPPSVVRSLLGPERLLGISVTTVEEALQAEADGADYLGVGSIYPTDTIEGAVLVSIEELIRIQKAVSIPVVAIGGIDESNAPLLRKTGIDGIAVVSAILSKPDIQEAASQLKESVSF